nr:hypothetical protein [Corynebacterium aquilae]
MWDFLFEYYSLSPSKLAQWHPGVGVAVPADFPLDAEKDYVVFDDPHFSGGRLRCVNIPAATKRRGQAWEFMAELLARTESNPAHFDCFGLHEWAMVYRADETRHALPLRLGGTGTDQVVDSHAIRCTHYDAFRFFTPAARSHNSQLLTRESQTVCEQRGCLHATMDLYKWATKLGALVPGDVVLDAFELARDVRCLDMEASPYDCRDLGFSCVPIETAEGKARYVARQRQFAERGSQLRARLVQIINSARDATAMCAVGAQTPGVSR